VGPRLRCALLLVLALAAPGVAAAAERLRLGYAEGPDDRTVDLVLRRWAQGFAFRPEGGLEVRLADAATPAPAVAAALADGSIDLAWLPLATIAAEPHPLQLLELPLRGQPAEVVSRAATALTAENPWRDAGGATLLMAVAEAPAWLHTEAPVETGDVAGLALEAPTPALADWARRLGAAPGPGVDGALLSWSGLATARIPGLTRHLQLGAPPERAAALAPALGNRLWVLAMADGRLAALPAPARSALAASVDPDTAAVAGRGVDQVDRLTHERAQVPGETEHRFVAAPGTRWRLAAAETESELLARLSAQGLDANALRRAAMLAVARASAVRSEAAEARTRPPRRMGG
jgi:hypothetical protein